MLPSVERWYLFRLREEITKRRGTAFQDFFADLMEARHGSEFVRVKPGGHEGDWKCDGLLPLRRQLFASYAPDTMVAAKTKKKITEDFEGAEAWWKERFDEWVFVHNALEGLPAPVVDLLEALDRRGPKRVRRWGLPEFEGLVLALDPVVLARFFGSLPQEFDAVIAESLADVVPNNPVVDFEILTPSRPATELESFRDLWGIVETESVFERLSAAVTIEVGASAPSSVGSARHWSKNVAELEVIKDDGQWQRVLLSRSDDIRIVPPDVPSLARYPRGVPSVFADPAEARATWERAVSVGAVGALLDAYIGDLAHRLGDPWRALSVRDVDRHFVADVGDGRPGIVWAPIRTVEDVEKLVSDCADRADVAVAVDLVDPWIPTWPSPPRRLTLPDGVQRVSLADIMWSTETGRTVLRVGRFIEPAAPLEVVDLRLDVSAQHWRPRPSLPVGFQLTGLCNEDPTFLVDLFNRSPEEVRVSHAFLEVRVRHIKPHGIWSDGVLRPTCTIELPVEGGRVNAYRARLANPVIVAPGSYRRVAIKLSNFGNSWYGEVSFGLIHDRGVAAVPVLSVLT